MPSPNLCCCCDLKKGGTIIAWLDIIGGIFAIILAIGMLGLGAALPEVVAQVNNKNGDFDPNQQFLPEYSSPRKPDPNEVAVASTLLFTVAAILLVLGIFTVILGVVLLRGIKKESPYLLKIWLIFRVILLILGIIVNLIKYSIEFSEKEVLQDGLGFVFGIWYLAVVYYLRKEFIDKSGSFAPIGFQT